MTRPSPEARRFAASLLRKVARNLVDYGVPTAAEGAREVAAWLDASSVLDKDPYPVQFQDRAGRDPQHRHQADPSIQKADGPEGQGSFGGRTLIGVDFARDTSRDWTVDPEGFGGSDYPDPPDPE